MFKILPYEVTIGFFTILHYKKAVWIGDDSISRREIVVEYIILIVAVLAAGTLAGELGINAAWLLVPIVLLTLPSVVAMATGSPYLPTDRATLKRMLKMADIQPGETVVDLGCGDGRLVRAAHRLGARAVGYELSIYLYCIARLLGGAEIRYKSYWQADLQDVDVVFIYIEKRFLERFERELWPHLKPGCRVISNTFTLPTVQPTTIDEHHVFRYVKE